MISSKTQIGVENVTATRWFGCTSSGKAFYSNLVIAGGDIQTDNPVKVKCILKMGPEIETYPNVVSRYTIRGKVRLNLFNYQPCSLLMYKGCRHTREF